MDSDRVIITPGPSSSRHPGFLKPFARALRRHRAYNDILNYSTGVDEEGRRRAEDSVCPFYGAVQIKGDGENQFRLRNVLHHGRAGVFDGDTQNVVAVPV